MNIVRIELIVVSGKEFKSVNLVCTDPSNKKGEGSFYLEGGQKELDGCKIVSAHIFRLIEKEGVAGKYTTVERDFK